MSFNILYNIIAADRFSAVAKNIARQVTAMNARMHTFNKTLVKSSKHLSKVGRTLSTHISLPLSIMGYAAIKSAGEFERSMNLVKGKTGATKKEFAELRKEVMGLGEATQFSPLKIGKAVAVMASDSIKIKQILSMTPKILQAASATQSGIESTARVITGVMLGYNLKPAQMERVTDLIVATITKSKLNMEDFGQGMKRLTTIASLMGLKFSEVAAMIGELSKSNVPASMISRWSAAAIRAIVSPNAVMTNVMRQQHLSFKKANGQMKSMVNILKMLKKHHLSPYMAFKMFGAQGSQVILYLMQKGPAALLAYQQALVAAVGISKRLAAINMKGITGAMLKLKSAAQALSITTTTSVEPAILGLTGMLTHFVLWLNSSSTYTKKFTAYVIGFGIILGPATLALAKFLIIMSFLMEKVPIVSTAIKGLGAGIAFLWDAMLGPIGLAIAAIAAFIAITYELIKHWSAVKAASKQFIDAFLGIAAAAKPAESNLDKLIGKGKKFISIFGGAEPKKFQAMTQHLVSSMLNPLGVPNIGMPMPHAGATPTALKTHHTKIHSKVDINLHDGAGAVKSITGKTTWGELNFNLGNNMSMSRI